MRVMGAKVRLLGYINAENVNTLARKKRRLNHLGTEYAVTFSQFTVIITRS
ncbi:MAG: hypothetical protein LBJ95_03555 [Oscillospiraceae bacterium]|nr:hypothetical protein [Oscillospiraceae bacterium]